MWATLENKEEPKGVYGKLFKKFTESSTVHGTFFWSEAPGVVGKAIWVLVVLCGISGACWIIDNCFKVWESYPVITAVAQIPIEQVPFPSITICPLDGTPFGFVENELNHRRESEDVAAIKFGNAFSDAVQILRTERYLSEDCEKALCLAGNDDQTSGNFCPVDSKKFKEWLTTMSGLNQAEYETRVQDLINSSLSAKIMAEFAFDDSLKQDIFVDVNSKEPLSCVRAANDFILFDKVRATFSTPIAKSNFRPGSFMRWIYVQSVDRIRRKVIFDKYLQGVETVYLDNVAIPEVVDMVSGPLLLNDTASLELNFSSDMIKMIRASHHAPHLIDNFNVGQTANPAFPFCWYDDETKDTSGTPAGPYNERYCNNFQTTFNEEGLCFTYNNDDLGKFSRLAQPADQPKGHFDIRSVKGCGKKKGLTLVLDDQSMAHIHHKSKKKAPGFMVFITVPGAVTHKVPFHVQPSLAGEYNFYFHGLHFIDASDEFKDWNKEKQVCAFTNDRNLSYLSQYYKQDNCLLECKLNKISKLCGCSPWYLNQTDLPKCKVKGRKCFKDRLESYSEDLLDREVCGCPGDCEMIHFFSSMEKVSVVDVPRDFWFDQGQGQLANYLMDPKSFHRDAAIDQLDVILHNSSGISDLAEHRLSNDIVILNFFFDTPIITRITLKMRISIFDQISAIGGTLGLFTGVSLVTFVEVFFWIFSFATAGYASRSTSSKRTEAEQMPRGILVASKIATNSVTDNFASTYANYN